jgi:putative proteasome-type protease
MDSTIRSNLSVGMPLDLLIYEAGSLNIKTHVSIEADDPYFSQLRTQWGQRLREAFDDMLDIQY